MENSKKPGGSKSVLVIVMLLFVLWRLISFVHQIGYLPFWGAQIAGRELTRYASERLGATTPIQCAFDWYNGRYSDTSDRSLYYYLRGNIIHDQDLSSAIDEEARADYAKIPKNPSANLTLPGDILLWTEISAADYSLKAQRLYLLGIWNEDRALSEDESLKLPAKIAMDVISQMGEKYNITGIQISYHDKNGIFEIWLPADSFEPLTEEKLLKNTQKRLDEPPETYSLWLAEKGFR